MEKYTVQSAFVVADQMVHVNMVNTERKIEALFPAKFAPVLPAGTRVDVFSSKYDQDLQLAYVFGGNMLFGLSPDGILRARTVYDLIPGLGEFSFDKFRFCRAVQNSLHRRGMKSTGSLVRDIMLIQRQNQK